jgi:hypothetical protein
MGSCGPNEEELCGSNGDCPSGLLCVPATISDFHGAPYSTGTCEVGSGGDAGTEGAPETLDGANEPSEADTRTDAMHLDGDTDSAPESGTADSPSDGPSESGE